MPKKAVKRVKAGMSKVSAADRHAAFAEAYLANGQNALQAAITAGYSKRSAGSQGHRLLKDVQVQQIIARRRTEIAANLELNTERTLREVSRLAYCDPRGIMHDDGRVKMPHELDDDTAAAIASFEINAAGEIKYKFWDKNSALDKAAKVQGLYEKDNSQKTDQITVITHRIIG